MAAKSGSELYPVLVVGALAAADFEIEPIGEEAAPFGGDAGLAGALLTFHLGAIAPETGDQLIIKAFAIIVLGGLGSMAGTVIGAYVLAGAETFVLIMNWGTWVDAVSFGLIFLILLVRPQGLLGRKEVRRT